MFDTAKLKIALGASLLISSIGFLLHLFFFTTLISLLLTIFYLFLFWFLGMYLFLMAAQQLFPPLYSALLMQPVGVGGQAKEGYDGKHEDADNNADDADDDDDDDDDADDNADDDSDKSNDFSEAKLHTMDENLGAEKDDNLEATLAGIEESVEDKTSFSESKASDAEKNKSAKKASVRPSFKPVGKEKAVLKKFKDFDSKQMARAVSTMMDDDAAQLLPLSPKKEEL